MFKKFMAFALVCVMVLSLVACGDKKETNTTETSATPTVGGEQTTPTPEATPYAPSPLDHSKDLPADAASYVNFEDGAAGFVKIAYSNAACNLASTLSVADFAGSKAIVVESPVSDNVFSGTQPYIAIDVVALLGDKAADVATVQFDIGADYKGADFQAVAGNVSFFTGAANSETKSNWAIYVGEENPKVYKLAVPEGGFDVTAQNYMCINVAGDNPITTDKISLALDNFVFYDKDGNVIVPDTTKEFTTVATISDSFWMNLDWSNAVKQPANEKIVAGAGEAFGGGWWPSAKNALSWTVDGQGAGYVAMGPDDFKSGQVLTIYYDGEGDSEWQFPYIRVQSWADADEEGNTTWAGTAFDYQLTLQKDDAGSTLISDTDQRNLSWTIVQYTYDELNAVFTEKIGEDWQTKMDFMGIADMGFTGTIHKITIGDIQ